MCNNISLCDLQSQILIIIIILCGSALQFFSFPYSPHYIFAYLHFLLPTLTTNNHVVVPAFWHWRMNEMIWKRRSGKWNILDRLCAVVEVVVIFLWYASFLWVSYVLWIIVVVFLPFFLLIFIIEMHMK